MKDFCAAPSNTVPKESVNIDNVKVDGRIKWVNNTPETSLKSDIDVQSLNYSKNDFNHQCMTPVHLLHAVC